MDTPALMRDGGVFGGVIYLYSFTKGSLESMQAESIVCNLWIQGVWNLRSIVVKHELRICWSKGLDVIAPSADKA